MDLATMNRVTVTDRQRDKQTYDITVQIAYTVLYCVQYDQHSHYDLVVRNAVNFCRLC